MNFISCVKWIKQGVAKKIPYSISLNEEELDEVIKYNEFKKYKKKNVKVKDEDNSPDEYDFENYDVEKSDLKINLKDVVTVEKSNSNQKSKKTGQDSDECSDVEDTIRGNDNLILVGHIDENAYTLEVYIYNEDDSDMYIHHDVYLKTPPLCVEWFTINTVSGISNLCAVGGMNPVIEIWDLDIINSVVPVFKLGRHKKKNTSKNFGHTDAVLSIAWNTELPHILCSGSVDKRALLWDLDTGKVHTEISVFLDKVQALLWNPNNPYYLLTGCADKYLRNFDCRTYNEFQEFRLNDAIESVYWDINNEYFCFAGTEDGCIYNIDIRMEKPLWKFQAHQKEITGISIDKTHPEVLITISTDECIKLWDVSSEPKLLTSTDLKLEKLHCIDMNPNYPYLACVGGSSELNNKKLLKVINLNKTLNFKEINSINNSSIPLLDKKESLNKNKRIFNSKNKNKKNSRKKI